jgi:hypothetical protein
MIDERWIGRDLEGDRINVIDVLLQYSELNSREKNGIFWDVTL